MRRKELQKSKEFALNVVKDCHFATLAMSGNGPYCVPITVVLCGGVIYFHCAPEGLKLDMIRAYPKVCLCCVTKAENAPEKHTMKYESAIVMGKCTEVEDPQERLMAVTAISEKYGHPTDHINNSLDRTTVCRITIDEIYGKSNV